MRYRRRRPFLCNSLLGMTPRYIRYRAWKMLRQSIFTFPVHRVILFYDGRYSFGKLYYSIWSIPRSISGTEAAHPERGGVL